MPRKTQITLSDIAEPCEGSICIFESFPNTIPKGLRRYMIPYIHANNEQYWKTYKLDGIRTLIHFDTKCQKVYIIDRLLNYYQIHTEFPSIITDNMTIDGELIRISSSNMVFFFAFDLVQHGGKTLISENTTISFESRYHLLSKELSHITSVGVINICIKKFYHIYQHMSCTYSENLPLSVLGTSPGTNYNNLLFSVDGIIITNNKYDDDVMKWKPVPTIDVVVHKSDIQSEHVMTYYWDYNTKNKRKERTKFRYCVIQDDYVKQCILSSPYHWVCVECRVKTMGTDNWVIIGTRPDKTRSNSAYVIHDTLDIISECVSESEFTCYRPTSYDHWIIDAWSQNTHLYELECRLSYKNSGSIEPSVFYHILSTCHNRFKQFNILRTIDYTNDGMRITIHDDDFRQRTVIRKRKYLSDVQELNGNWTMCVVLSSEIPVSSCERTRHVNGNESYTELTRKKHRTRFNCHSTGLFIDFTVVSHPKNNDYTFEIEIEYSNECTLKRDELFRFISDIVIV